MRRKDRYSNLAAGLYPYFTRMSRPQPLIDGGAGGGEAAGFKQYATFVIAANDSTDDGKANADYVCDGTADEVEINAALAAATPSGFRRVLLLEGTFNIADDIVLTSNSVLEGQGQDVTILTTGWKTPNNIGYNFVISNIDNVEIKNLQITNNLTLTSYTINIEMNCNDISITNCLFYAVKAEYCIIVTENITRLTVSNNRFIGCDFGGLFDLWMNTSFSAKFITITNNTIVRDTVFGAGNLMFNFDALNITTDPNDLYIKHIVVSGNKLRTVGDLGQRDNLVYIYGASGVVVSDNIADFIYTFCEINDCFDCSITGNVVTQFGNGVVCDNGMDVDSGGGSRFYTIAGNTFRFGGGDAIALTGPFVDGAVYGFEDIHAERVAEDYRTYAVISGNTIHECTVGISCQLAANVTITGNAISGVTTAGIYLFEAWVITISGNTISESNNGVEMALTYDVNIVGNLFNDAQDGEGNPGDSINLREAHYTNINANRFLGTGGIHVIEYPIGDTGATYLSISGNTFGKNSGGFGYEGDINFVSITYNTFLGWGSAFNFPPPLLSPPSVGEFLIEGNIYHGGDTEHKLAASGSDISEWAPGATSPATAVWDGRFSRLFIVPISGYPETSITALSPDNALEGQVYIISPLLNVGGGTYQSITIVHGNNVHLDGGVDFLMDDPYDRLMMEYRSGHFAELSRSTAVSYTYGSELVTNSDVETGSGTPSNWTGSGTGAVWSTAESQSTSHSLLINDLSSSWTSDAISVSASTNYVIQVALYTPTWATTGAMRWRIEWYDSVPTLLSTNELTLGTIIPAWTTRQMWLTSPATAATAKIVFENDGSDAGAVEMHADDFSMKTYS